MCRLQVACVTHWARCNEVTRERDELAAAAKMLLAERDGLVADVERQRAERIAMAGGIKRLRAERDRLRGERNEMSARVVGLIGESARMRKVLKVVHEGNEELNGELDAANGRIAALETRVAEPRVVPRRSARLRGGAALK